MTGKQLTGRANAKINLGLEVIRKRPDGYHDLRTIFYPISLEDEITCVMSDGGCTLDVNGTGIPSDDSNLCLQAAYALKSGSGFDGGARINLKKRIPVGAGHGGGSSDAACVLLLLNELWETRLPFDTLSSLAAQLGADVPYFLTGGIAFADGRGDRLERLKVSFPHWVVTAAPPEQVSTAWAYGRVTPNDARPADLREGFLAGAADLDALDALLVNDFEMVVLPEYPVIESAMNLLRTSGASCVRMSGSGSAIFGVVRTEDHARRVAATLDPRWTISITPPYVP